MASIDTLTSMQLCTISHIHTLHSSVRHRQRTCCAKCLHSHDGEHEECCLLGCVVWLEVTDIWKESAADLLSSLQCCCGDVFPYEHNKIIDEYGLSLPLYILVLDTIHVTVWSDMRHNMKYIGYITTRGTPGISVGSSTWENMKVNITAIICEGRNCI